MKLLKILLIDDDIMTNFINEKNLRKHFLNNEIKSFISAINALEYIISSFKENNTQKNLIFVDINMPKMDGWEFLDEYKKLPDDLKATNHIYMLSSTCNKNDIEKSKHYSSVKSFFTKPLTHDNINLIHSSI
ncbi:response regulator [Pseudofulvibacter geojedonensis]|uniref:Response regulator n=1 Tax=Pseudofulvibacter geojedonensis TaxID=1123758 RepID=A0ABW3I113_9FLAO